MSRAEQGVIFGLGMRSDIGFPAFAGEELTPTNNAALSTRRRLRGTTRYPAFAFTAFGVAISYHQSIRMKAPAE